jgi:Acyl-CoA thioesterase N-terminal domain
VSADAYYLPAGDGRFSATEHTVGPWSAGVQHMGPPAALLARAMQRCQPREDTALTKLTVDILGPVPQAEVEVTAIMLRPGRTIELIGAELSVAGTVAARATGWRLAHADTAALATGAAHRGRLGQRAVGEARPGSLALPQHRPVGASAPPAPPRMGRCSGKYGYRPFRSRRGHG